MKWNGFKRAILLALWDQAAYPQAPPDSNQYVSRKEYDKLKAGDGGPQS